MTYSTIVGALPSVTPFVGPEALERKVGRSLLLRLGANESPFGPSSAAIEAMQAQVLLAQNYGDPEGFLLRSALSELHGVPVECIVLGAGVDELLALCTKLFVDPGSPIVTTLGSYPTFDYGAAGCGAAFHRVAYRDEAPDLAGLLDKARASGARILYLANPDNPSGAWFEPSLIAELRSGLPEGCVLLLDEAYCDFAPSAPAFDVADPQVIRLRTFSKAHGMAGMRVGYTVSHPDHAVALNKIRMHFGVSCVSQAGAVASLSDLAHVQYVVDETAQGRAELAAFFAGLGFRPLPSHTNFITVDVGSKPRAEGILATLLEHGVFIRKPGLPPLDGCIRVTIGRAEQRAKFMEIFSVTQGY